jgi:hypothetical protein
MFALICSILTGACLPCQFFVAHCLYKAQGRSPESIKGELRLQADRLTLPARPQFEHNAVR